MQKPEFLYMLIEAVIFLIPLCALFIKLGRQQKIMEDTQEKTKGLPEWKAIVNEKIATLEINDIQQNQTLTSINDNLVKISTQVQLLLDNRIRMENK